jgi:hypothetical protein
MGNLLVFYNHQIQTSLHYKQQVVVVDVIVVILRDLVDLVEVLPDQVIVVVQETQVDIHHQKEILAEYLIPDVVRIDLEEEVVVPAVVATIPLQIAQAHLAVLEYQ